MIDFAANFKTCITSDNLGKKHQSLINLIAGVIPILNDEIGEIGDAAIREILQIQEGYTSKVKQGLLPFSSEADNHNTYLYVVLGQVENDGQKYNVGIRAETPWHGDWDYLGWSGAESMPYDIRALSREEAGVAARRLTLAIFVLNEVYREPGTALANLADELRKANIIQMNPDT